jgi:hypothetical protein
LAVLYLKYNTIQFFYVVDKELNITLSLNQNY